MSSSAPFVIAWTTGIFAYLLFHTIACGPTCQFVLMDTPDVSTRGTMIFSVQQLIALNQTIKENYDTWYRNAPDSYKRPLFQNSVPQAFSVRYGQNRLIYKPERAERAALARYWDLEINFPKVARIGLAIPVHYRYVQVTL